MLQPRAVDRTSQGDLRIAQCVKNCARRLHLNDLDREDFAQDVHVELCKDLGQGYRETLSLGTPDFWSSAEGRTLQRCAERVKKQFRDAWKKARRSCFQPFDKACLDDAKASVDSIASQILELEDELPADELRLLNLLNSGTPDNDIQLILNIKRSSLYKFKRRLYLNLESKLITTPHRG